MKHPIILSILLILCSACEPPKRSKSGFATLQNPEKILNLFDAVEKGTLEDIEGFVRKGDSLLIENEQGNLLHALARSVRNRKLHFHRIHEKSADLLEVGLKIPGYDQIQTSSPAQSLLIKQKPHFSVATLLSSQPSEKQITINPQDTSTLGNVDSSLRYALQIGPKWYVCSFQEKSISINTKEVESVYTILQSYVSRRKKATSVETRFSECSRKIEYLLKNGVQPSATNPQGRNVRDEAIYFGHTDFVEALSSSL